MLNIVNPEKHFYFCGTDSYLKVTHFFFVPANNITASTACLTNKKLMFGKCLLKKIETEFTSVNGEV